MTYNSTALDEEWKYALPDAPRRQGYMQTADGHSIYWAEYGNAAGEPVMFFHGGPGGACSPTDARFFNPERYRIILFDQRGCGQSLPNASVDPKAALTNNTTQHLIADVLQLRDALRVSGKMHILGGSWGSTFALAYAIAHPETVQTLVLRGIFLCRKKDLDFFYQGNAVSYHKDANDTSLPGAYMFFPEAWKDFVEVIDVAKRGDMIKAYAEIFAGAPSAAQDAAAKAWTVWEGTTSYLSQHKNDIGKFGDMAFAKAFAKIENHYFMNGAFLGGSGEGNRDNNYLLANVGRIAHIPVHIVHGQYDIVCPRFQADELIAALGKAGARSIDYRLTPYGHSRTELGNMQEQVDIFDHLPPL